VSREVLIESVIAPWRLVFKPFRAIV
jgi:hypothetical protein